MDWRLLTVLVCLFGFFKELRPSEAYLTPYLTGKWKNLTIEQVDNEMYPWWTYSYLLWLVPVFLLTDFLRYKPMLIVDGLAYIATWALLLWAQGLPAMKCVEVTYGLCTAGEIGYFSYLYALVSNEHYKKVASFTRVALLSGRFFAYLIGQLLISFNVMDYYQLNIISFSCVIAAFVIVAFLPRVAHSEIFHRYKSDKSDTLDTAEQTQETNVKEQTQETNVEEQIQETNVKATPLSTKLKMGVVFMKSEIKASYTSRTVMIWSAWWALASCGNFQVQNYIQNLWETIAPHRDSTTVYNGAVEAVGTLLAAVSVLLVGFVPVEWSIKGRAEILMAAVCALNAVCLVIIGRTDEIWVAYILYDVFRATYLSVITIATAQIAKSLKHKRYGFVFGCNMFLALLIETILTVIVVDKAGLGVDVQTQFQVYGGYFGFMTVLFLVVVFVRLYKQGFSQ